MSKPTKPAARRAARRPASTTAPAPTSPSTPSGRASTSSSPSRDSGRTKAARALLERGQAVPFSEVCLRYGARRRVMFSAGAEAPPALKDLADRFFDQGGVLRDEAFARFEAFVAEARAIGHELRCYDDALAFIAEVRDAAHRRAVVDRRYGNGDGRAAGLVKADLYAYQREGALSAAPRPRSSANSPREWTRTSSSP